MTARRLVKSQHADADLAAIWHESAQRHGRDHADRSIDRVYRRFDLLAGNPGLGVRRPWISTGLRSPGRIGDRAARGGSGRGTPALLRRQPRYPPPRDRRRERGRRLPRRAVQQPGPLQRPVPDAFSGIAFEVHGTPKDLASARDLALRDKYQFQWWAVSLVGAVPYGGRKVPKIQILTVSELLEREKRPQMPLVDAGAFRKAPREDTSRDRQSSLL